MSVHRLTGLDAFNLNGIQSGIC